MRHQTGLVFWGSSGKQVGERQGLQEMEIMEYLPNFDLISPSCRLYGLEAGHSTALGPSAFFGKIFRYTPQLDIQDRERDNPHRAGSENRMYLSGHLDAGCWFWGAAGPSLPIYPGARVFSL